jgi:hypothetical protein
MRILNTIVLLNLSFSLDCVELTIMFSLKSVECPPPFNQKGREYPSQLELRILTSQIGLVECNTMLDLRLYWLTPHKLGTSIILFPIICSTLWLEHIIHIWNGLAFVLTFFSEKFYTFSYKDNDINSYKSIFKNDMSFKLLKKTY